MSNLKRLTVEQNNMLLGLLKDYGPVLTDWEYNFVSTIVKFKKMSDKQKEVIKQIYSTL